jgi:signal transduction histidine kinase/CheY-like chemotaxis protein
MIKLDAGTVGFTTAIIALVLSLVIPVTGSDRAQRDRFHMFSIAMAFYGIGLLAIVNRGTVPFYLSILGGNYLVLISALALHAGVSVIVQRKPLIGLYIVVAALFLVGESYFMAIDDNLNARIALISLARIPFFFHSVILLHQARRRELSLGFAMMEIVFSIWTLLLIYRLADSLLGVELVASFTSLVGFQVIFLAATGLGKVILVVALYHIDSESLSRGLALNNAELANANRVLLEEITQRKEAEERLLLSKDTAEAATASKSKFLAAASHDLRQPLQAIRLFTEAMSRTDLSPEQKRIGDYLSQSTQSLNDLLNALLDISKLDGGMVRPNIETFPVELLMQKVDVEFSSMATEKSLRLILSFPFGKMAVVTDGKLLMSLVGNLVGNAIKYTQRGGVLVAIRRRGNQALFQVWDTGIGMEATHLNRIFEEYVQIDNPERDRSKGLGLGLAIAKRIANLLNTEVACRSRLGKGSVFEFRLPLAAPAVTNMPDPNRFVETDNKAQSKLIGRRIVLVEDDTMVATATKLALESMGMSVTRYGTSEEALADSKIIDADSYIADLRLPGINGIEFLDSVQKMSANPIKAVVVTGDTAVNQIQMIQSSPWQVLFKPVDLSSLLCAIGATDSVHCMDGPEKLI